MTPNVFCLTVRFLDPVPTFHGLGNGGAPEWPPSPLRLFQALVAAAAARWRDENFVIEAQPALRWLESRAPVIVAPEVQSRRTPFRLYVPHNAGDLMTAAWDRGDIDASMAKHRMEKDVWPTRLVVEGSDPAAIHYLYPLTEADSDFSTVKATLTDAAHSITHLGWGTDMAVADVSVLNKEDAARLAGQRWLPKAGGSSRLRVPRVGTLEGLIRRHTAFVDRICNNSFTPVPPLSEFDLVSYQPPFLSIARPCAVFQLLNDDDSRFGYPQEKLIHIAGMVRHLAIEFLSNSPPEDVPADWVQNYVAGHVKFDDTPHRQFSYLPLPSIGYFHADPSIRRVMIVAPVGDGRFVNYLSMLIAGQRLKPTSQTRLANPPTLVRTLGDTVTALYIKPATVWASVTPVILPGHDDHKPEKTRRLIVKALRQSGVDQPCEFEWSAFSHFPKSLSAHKYDRQKRLIGYFRPDHLLNLTAVHLSLTFKHPVAGPLAIGAGRHCGLGTFARAH